MVMNPCESCPFSSALSKATGAVEIFSHELTDRSDKVWGLALRAHDAAEELNGLSENPAAIADVDQKQSHILDTTARLARISHEVRLLVEVTFERADLAECPPETDTAIKCPKMHIVLGIQPELDEILEELPR